MKEKWSTCLSQSRQMCFVVCLGEMTNWAMFDWFKLSEEQIHLSHHVKKQSQKNTMYLSLPAVCYISRIFNPTCWLTYNVLQLYMCASIQILHYDEI
jgi:hypothetical protein